LPKVEILYSYVQPNTAVIQALVGSGVQGIIFAGTGDGGLSSFEKAALKPIISSPADSRPCWYAPAGLATVVSLAAMIMTAWG